MTVAASSLDERVIADVWRHVQLHGELPAGVKIVQSRKIRQVGLLELPSGQAYCKVMAFPRRKDRIRYLVRSLPAVHEARMLQRVAAAGIPCPEVLAVRTSRRLGVPHRSLLVLGALALAGDPSLTPAQQLRQRAEVAQRLVTAGLWHPDLHPDNFVLLADGRLAVLDLQSMRQVGAGRSRARAAQDMAARLLLESVAVPVAAALTELVSAGLISQADCAVVDRRARQVTLALLRRRVLRCLHDSSEYVRTSSWRGTECRRRGDLPAGGWVDGGAEILQGWLGQRQSELFDGRAPQIPAFRRKWLWLPRRNSLYIPASMAADRRVVSDAVEGFDRYSWLWGRGENVDLEQLRELRLRQLTGDRSADGVSAS